MVQAHDSLGCADPAGQEYPPLQLVHDVAPDTLKRPAAHIALAGFAVAEPAGHA
jgi:hypothetical protein